MQDYSTRTVERVARFQHKDDRTIVCRRLRVKVGLTVAEVGPTIPVVGNHEMGGRDKLKGESCPAKGKAGSTRRNQQ